MLTPLEVFAEAQRASPALTIRVVSVDLDVFSASSTSPKILFASPGVCPTGTKYRLKAIGPLNVFAVKMLLTMPLLVNVLRFVFVVVRRTGPINLDGLYAIGSPS